jgi:hypothetical protein
MKDFIYSGIVKNWITTVLGLVAAIMQVLYPVISSGKAPTKQEWINAALLVLAGFFTKSFNVTGGVPKQDTPMVQASDITKTELAKNKE